MPMPSHPDPHAPSNGKDSSGVLMLSLEGFEGPIDLLLALAREQKVDFGTLSILALAEQYLALIEAAQQVRLELAGDWLVMAAWLAWLKSRWLLPDPPPQDEPERAALARDLTFQLQRLDAMRQASLSLFARPQLGEDVLACAQSMEIPVDVKPLWHLPLADLLRALGASLRRREPENWMIAASALCPLEESLTRLRAFLEERDDWVALDHFWPLYHAFRHERQETHDTSADAPDGVHDGRNDETCKNERAAMEARSVTASSFAAALELAKEGGVEIRQEEAFGRVWVRNSPFSS